MEKKLVQTLARFRGDLRAIETRLYREARAELRNDEARIASARTLVEEAGLDQALPKILERVWHWPSWLSRPDASTHVGAERLGMTNVTGEETKTGKGILKRVRFEWQGHSYGFEFEQDSGQFEGMRFGKIRFLADSEIVLSMRVTHDLGKGGEYWNWSPSNIEVLRVGDWAGVVLEIEHAIRVDEQATRLSRDAKYIRDLAEGLPKPGP